MTEDPELKTLDTVVRELSYLTEDARRRVLGYIEQRFGPDKCRATWAGGPEHLPDRCTLLAGHAGRHVSAAGVVTWTDELR